MIAELTHPGRTSARETLLDLVARLDRTAGELAAAEAAVEAARAEYAAAGSEWRKFQDSEQTAYRDGRLPEWRETARPAEARFQAAQKVARAAAGDLPLARAAERAARVVLGRALHSRGLVVVILPDGRVLIDRTVQRPVDPNEIRIDGQPAGPPPPDHDASLHKPVNLDELI
jgi:multidrug efflux pump subunit AcrA (membrane-fusion protein)